MEAEETSRSLIYYTLWGEYYKLHSANFYHSTKICFPHLYHKLRFTLKSFQQPCHCIGQISTEACRDTPHDPHMDHEHRYERNEPPEGFSSLSRVRREAVIANSSLRSSSSFQETAMNVLNDSLGPVSRQPKGLLVLSAIFRPRDTLLICLFELALLVDLTRWDLWLVIDGNAENRSCSCK